MDFEFPARSSSNLPFFHVSVALADDDAAAIAVAVALGGRPRLSPSRGLLSELLSDEDLRKDTFTLLTND